MFPSSHCTVGVNQLVVQSGLSLTKWPDVEPLVPRLLNELCFDPVFGRAAIYGNAGLMSRTPLSPPLNYNNVRGTAMQFIAPWSIMSYMYGKPLEITIGLKLFHKESKQ